MSSRTSAGTIIGISAAAPATYDTTGYAALTYTTIGEITDLGEFGREYNLVTHNPVAVRSTIKKKGSFNEGTMTLQLAIDEADAGQILAKTASDSDNDYSFKLTTQGGQIYYFRAQVMSFKRSLGSVDNIFSGTITLEITTNSAGVGIVQAP